MAHNVQTIVPYPPSVPTVRPNIHFDARADCKTLKDAMKGMGTDEIAIIELLTKSNLTQRLQLVESYKIIYEKDLVDKLKSELSGKLETAVLALLQPPAVYDAHSLHGAMAGAGTDEETLIEIIFSRSNTELKAIKKAYRDLYKKDLEKDIIGDTSGPFQRLLLSLLLSGRNVAFASNPPGGYKVDLHKAQLDAKFLFDSGVKKWATDENILISIFAERSIAHLKLVFEEYKVIAKTDVETVIKDGLKGDTKASLLAVAEFVNNKNVYFAKRLYESMKGLGTNDKRLIRIIVSRSEVDLESIKDEFQRLYGKDLSSFIKGDTSGDFKKILLCLTGARASARS